MAYTLLLFDADGVLVQTNASIPQALTRKLNLTIEDLIPMWKGIYRELSSGIHTTDEFLRLFEEAYHLPQGSLSQEDFTVPYKAVLEPVPGIEELLDKLAKKGVRMAVLSDTTEMIHLTRKEHKVFQYFDSQFLSFAIGHVKPDRRAFEAVLSHYHAQAAEVLFIDDNPRNVTAAKDLGMGGVVFTDTRHLTETLQALQIL